MTLKSSEWFQSSLSWAGAFMAFLTQHRLPPIPLIHDFLLRLSYAVNSLNSFVGWAEQPQSCFSSLEQVSINSCFVG